MATVENKRIAIFIDGGNFYRKIRENDLVPKGIRFNYIAFAEFLTMKRTLVSKFYYIGIVRNHDKREKPKNGRKSAKTFKRFGKWRV